MADIDRNGNKIFTQGGMNTRYPRFYLFLMACLAALRLSGAETAPSTAVVKAKVANVRGQPSLIGEVVTRLKQGDRVMILEELKVKATKNDDTTNWFRIQMPANTPVWVNSGFVDTNANTIKPPKLNLRAGPGENYSVVGRLVKGESIKPIRSVESWMEIECPTNAYAFLAANLVEKSELPAPPVEVEKPKTPVEDVVKAVPEKTNIPSPVPAVETVKNEEKTAQPPAVVIEPPPVSSSAAAAPTLVTPPALVTAPPLAAPLAQPNLAPSKRIVRREGTVSGWVSIVAPTGYTLKNAENGHVMNYLQSTSTNIVLKNYRGKKVVVTGEEGVDSRWIETPVLTIQTLEIAPNDKK
jgi:uncharacterized Zn ribbon protein